MSYRILMLPFERKIWENDGDNLGSLSKNGY